MEKQVVVEINKLSPLDIAPNQQPQQEIKKSAEHPKKTGTKSLKEENFDEITTIKRDEDMDEEAKEIENIINGSRTGKEEACENHKGFSFQRAWCCLNRRTS